MLLWVLLLCAMPVLASYLTYYVLRPEGRRNYGDLIEPQRPLPSQSVMDLNQQPSDLTALAGQWLLLSVAGGACDKTCREHLYLQRQLRESLGKNKERLESVWLIPDQAALPEALRPALKGTTVLRIVPAGLSAWLAPASGQQLADHLYVVDPMGNWMMRFPAALDLERAALARRDLERLMRASASWDRPGR